MRTLDELAIPTLEAMLKLMQKPGDQDALNDLTAIIQEARPDFTPAHARAVAENEARMLSLEVTQA